MQRRCQWCGEDPLYVAYHDLEWGVPDRDSRALFEKLVLDGFQAGLSWYTILAKRDAFREAFAGFVPDVLANWGDAEVTRLLANPRIVRHRGKIEATITNARVWQDIEANRGFSTFVWEVVDGEPVQNHFESEDQIPAATQQSELLAKRLRAAGFKFCGPTICYAFMQAVGLVNDHVVTCPAYQRCLELGRHQ